MYELRNEQYKTNRKIEELIDFRETKEWKKMTSIEKELIDIQIANLKSYMEILSGRIICILDKEEGK